ncbi:MAG: hypothetical protein HRU41_21230 [Saprospiraceae bacterium]|nr:hypothetical protein [Saprospiraceae bacterium]
MKQLIRLLTLYTFFLGLPSTTLTQEAQLTPQVQKIQETQNARLNSNVRENQGKSEVDDSYKPLLVKLSPDGKKYARFIVWHQHWLQTNNLAEEGAALRFTNSIRRSRMMVYAQVSPNFLILTHFGLNNLTPTNITSLGNDGDAAQFFLHEAWVEYKVTHNNALFLGGGLHYWRGLTRFASHGTSTFMTFDHPRPFIHWHSSAVTDQFNRHLGIYAKGQIKGFDYRLAMNNPGRNGLQQHFGDEDVSLVYNGFEHSDKNGNPVGNTLIEGYFRYNFWDKESTFIPNTTGTYIGHKKVLAIGGGFFAHPHGMYNQADGEHGNIFHYAADVYLDTPLSQDDCLNIYAALMKFDYGRNFVSRWVGTGTGFYGQLGYKLPRSRFMPYMALQSASYEGLNEAIQVLDFGLNYFLNGHNAKFTLEYHSVLNDGRESGFNPVTGAPFDLRIIRLQAQVAL